MANLCVFDSASAHTVTVTRDAEVAIDTATTQAGTLAYAVDVSLRGSAQIEVPLRVLPGVNGLAPALSLRYDSARQGDVTDKYTQDDTLGYGWHLAGPSVISRCRVGLTGAPAPVLDDTERLCLDGEPLAAVSGTYWALNTEYRTERQSFVKVIGRNAGGAIGAWYEVQYPDGRVANYGDTTDSQALASGQLTTQNLTGFVGPNPVYAWAIRQVSNGFADTLSYSYDRFDPYGMLQLKAINYGGAAVELKYGPRNDLANVLLGTSNKQGKIWRQAYLHTIRVLRGTTAVREYRLDSNADASGNVRLESIQECGYSEAGTNPSCLKPLALTWTAVSGGASPISVTGLTDGLGAITDFVYTAITSANNPTDDTYTEAPFGAPIADSATTARDIVVVTQLKRSNGLTGAGRQSTTYAYKGSAWASTLNRGFLGFYEVRAKDEERGRYTYTQTRLDFPYQGAVSQVRTLSGLFGAGTELAREERAYAVKTAGSSYYPYVARVTSWVLEGGTTVGGAEVVNTPCYRTLAGDTCPGSGTEGELPTQDHAVVTTGNAVSNPAFTPTVWGAVPDRTITGVKHTRMQVTNLANTASPWVVGNASKTIATDTTTGASARMVTNTYTYQAGTRELLTATAFPGDTNLARTTTRSFTGNNLTSETLAGVGFATRTTSVGAAYVEDRYPPTVSNPLNQQSGLGYDLRHGAPKQVTDPDGRNHLTSYDAFGRTLSQTAPDGTTTTVAYARCDVAVCTAVPTGAVAALKITTTVMNGATQVAPTNSRYLDVRGREVLVETQALDTADGWRRVRTVYDAAGRVQYVSRPYFSSAATPDCASVANASGNCTWVSYDARDRVAQENRPDGGSTATTFSGATGTVTVTSTETVKQPGVADAMRAKQTVFNVLGRLTQTTDAFGSTMPVTTVYGYTSHGDLETVTVDGSNVATISYNDARQRFQIVEPNSGTTAIAFNALGEITATTDAKAQQSAYTYDLLGRLTQRVDTGTGLTTVTNAWDWDAPNATGALQSRTNNAGFTEAWTYRASDGKPTQVATTINVADVLPNTSYTKGFAYDSAQRLASVSYPGSATPGRVYTAQGYLQQLTNGATVLQAFTDTDAFGNVTQEQFSNNAFATTRGFDANTGRLLSIQTGPTATPKGVQDLEYTWRSNSTLLQRKDKRGTSGTTDDLLDQYGYDTLERVTQQATTGGASRTLDLVYSGKGNLTSKLSNVTSDLDATAFTYGTVGKPQRLNKVTIAVGGSGIVNTLSHDANGNIFEYNAATGDDTFLTFDARNNVTKITVGVSTGTTTPTAREEFWYDPDGQRYLGKESWNNGGTLQSVVTAYLGDYEEALSYTGTPLGSTTLTGTMQRVQASAAVRRIRSLNSGGTELSNEWEYVHRDHLGSVDAVTNAAGVLLNGKTSFDPFGARREAAWGSDITAANRLVVQTNEQARFTRGFTDHEQLNRTGFVHMNGRVYDTRIGRFVSPDPLVTAPLSSQSYNRYSYVANSPMSFTDPSGFTPAAHKKVAAINPSGSSIGGDVEIEIMVVTASRRQATGNVGDFLSMISGSSGGANTNVEWGTENGMLAVTVTHSDNATDEEDNLLRSHQFLMSLGLAPLWGKAAGLAMAGVGAYESFVGACNAALIFQEEQRKARDEFDQRVQNLEFVDVAAQQQALAAKTVANLGKTIAQNAWQRDAFKTAALRTALGVGAIFLGTNANSGSIGITGVAITSGIYRGLNMGGCPSGIFDP